MFKRKHVNLLLINRTVNGLTIPFYKKRASKNSLGTPGFKKLNTALNPIIFPFQLLFIILT